MKTKKKWTAKQKKIFEKYLENCEKVLQQSYINDTPDILRDLRKKYKFSQDQVAQILNISKYTIAHYETGKSRIPSDFIVKIACLYNISSDMLLGLKEYENK